MEQDQSGNKRCIGKWSAECEALRDNLKATAAAKNAEQEQSIEVLKKKSANLKIKTAKKGRSYRKNGENESPFDVRA